MRPLSRYGSNAVRCAELVIPELDGRPALATAQDLPGDLHLQGAQAAELEGPVHRQFYIQSLRQGLIGAEEEAFRADIAGLAHATVQNLSATESPCTANPTRRDTVGANDGRWGGHREKHKRRLKRDRGTFSPPLQTIDQSSVPTSRSLDQGCFCAYCTFC